MLLYIVLTLIAVGLIVALVLYLRPAKGPIPDSISADDGQSNKLPGDEVQEEVKKPKLFFFYGSQTGTAEDFSTQLEEDGTERGFECEALDLEDFEEDQLEDCDVAVFLMATYGEGDPTDNAAEFVDEWLGSDESNCIDPDDVQFAVFGLGNTEYDQYNAVGKLVDKRMEAIGCKRVFKFGMGDDSGDIEDDFNNWVDSGFWNAMRVACGMEPTDEDSSQASNAIPERLSVKSEFSLRVLPPETEVQPPDLDVKSQLTTTRTRHFFIAQPLQVVVNRELRNSTEGGSTRHIELRGGPKYRCADNLAICPDNPVAVVEAVAKRLKVALDDQFVLEARDPSKHKDLKPLFPTPCTVRCAFTRYVDLCGIPKKRVLKKLVAYTGKGEEREQLMRLTTVEGAEEYSALVGKHLTILTLLTRFTSIEIPLLDFLLVMPSLLPREYTISSSDLVHPDTIHISVSVTPGGLASTMLQTCTSAESTDTDTDTAESNAAGRKRARAEPSSDRRQRRRMSTVRGYVNTSTFKLPPSPLTPIVMVGPGTGLAPMRAFLQSRQHQRQAGEVVGPTILFFGCRRRDEDYIYRDELAGYQQDGTLTQLHTAFSREQEEKVYVQHVIAKQGESLWKLLSEDGAYVYVCGGTKMGSDVKDAFRQVCEQQGGLSAEKASQFVTEMETKNRYVQELWSV